MAKRMKKRNGKFNLPKAEVVPLAAAQVATPANGTNGHAPAPPVGAVEPISDPNLQKELRDLVQRLTELKAAHSDARLAILIQEEDLENKKKAEKQVAAAVHQVRTEYKSKLETILKAKNLVGADKCAWHFEVEKMQFTRTA